MLVDLHTHSCHSDGSDTPTQLMEAAAAAGVGLLGLTDHDTDDGWLEAAAAVGRTGVGLLRGVEVTSSLEGTSVHLLSYLHDPGEEAFAALLESNRTIRPRRAQEMVERLAADYPIDWEAVLQRAGDPATVGRPHLADALVAAGVFADRAAAFAGPLANRGPYYVELAAPHPAEVVERIVAAGGVAVIAHPFMAARGRVGEADIRQLAALGLAGIEADHRDHTAAERLRARSLARELGLLVTGSSDYHGTGKPNRLAEGVTAPEVAAEIAARGALPLVLP